MKRAIYIGKRNNLTLNEFGFGMTGDYDTNLDEFWPDDKELSALVYNFPIEDLYFSLL